MTTQRERRYGRVLSWAAVGTLLVSVVLPGGVQRAEAWGGVVYGPFTCGQTLDGNNTYIMTEDLRCFANDSTALYLVGPATLKLNGWSVTCFGLGATTGVDMQGKGATLLGAGTTELRANPKPTNEVRNCEENVAVSDGGHHWVQGVTVTSLAYVGDHLYPGFVVSTNAEFGFDVGSDNNWLVSNVAKNISGPSTEPEEGAFQGVGFYVTGNGNYLKDNVATGSAEHGFTIDGKNNRLKHNLAYQNNDNGFNVEKGVCNVFDSNVAQGNTDEGFVVGEAAKGNTFIYNTSFDNGTDGYLIEGDDSIVTFNIANGNALDGIHTETNVPKDPQPEEAERNTISRNKSLNNTQFDMHEDIDGCGTNTWYDNIFNTSKDGPNTPSTCIQ